MIEQSVLMWEVRVTPGRVEELLAFVLEHADASARVYRADGEDPRVVVIDPSGVGVPDVPEGLVARPPHAWSFDTVR